MELSNELKQAAQALGEALAGNPAVQDFQRADEAVKNSAEVSRLEAEVTALYHDLTSRQQTGEILSPQEINRFYLLRDQYSHHPLIIERMQRMRAAKMLFEQAGSAISSILTYDYSTLALDEEA